MFGLMRRRMCHSDAEQRKLHRLHYCGTCKTMGRMFGQKTRILLNHDVVFLAEILSALAQNGQAEGEWDAAYRSLNCLSLPKSNESMPLALQYAAAVNVVLSEIKLDDDITDSRFGGWRLARKFLSGNFCNAASQLEQWRYPLKEVWGWAHTQKEREKQFAESKNFQAGDTVVESLSEPTARMAGLTFQFGAKLLQRCDAENTMYNLGCAFGKLVYLLDAYEDYENDYRRQHFNAWRSALHLTGDRLATDNRKEIIEALLTLQDDIVECLIQLPIPRNHSAYFTENLKTNLAQKLREQLPIAVRTSRNLSNARITLAERWQLAKQYGQAAIESNGHFHSASFSARWNRSFRIAASTGFAFVFPFQLQFLKPKPCEKCNETSLNDHGICTKDASCGEVCCGLCLLYIVCQMIYYCCMPCVGECCGGPPTQYYDDRYYY